MARTYTMCIEKFDRKRMPPAMYVTNAWGGRGGWGWATEHMFKDNGGGPEYPDFLRNYTFFSADCRAGSTKQQK